MGMGKTVTTYLIYGDPKGNQYLLNSHELVGNYNTLSE